MKIPLLNRLERKPTPRDVLRSALNTRYHIFPSSLPGVLVSALEDAGFMIIRGDDFDNEIALAYEAGRESVE